MRGLFAAFLAECGLVAWRDLHQAKVLPPPSDFTGVAIFWTFLGLVATSDTFAPAAGAVGWMVVLATAIKAWTPSNPTRLGAPPPAPASTTAAVPAAKAPAKKG